MKMEYQFQYDYDRYPMLFQQRWQLLNQYFCVIGNGYDWVDGELVESYDERPIVDYTPVLREGKAYPSKEDNTDTNDISFYPLSEHSAIFTVPDNIKPDWLEGVKEVVRLLLVHGHGGDPKRWNDWQKGQHDMYTEKLVLLAKKLDV